MALAERADVLVDLRLLPSGTVVQMYNMGPDEPFGGFSGSPESGDEPTADPAPTGQVMRFVVKGNLFTLRDLITTPPWALRLNSEGPLGEPDGTRKVSLNELDSSDVCVAFDEETELFVVPIRQVDCTAPDPPLPAGQIAVPFGPEAALLRVVDPGTGEGVPLKWHDEALPNKPVEVMLQSGVQMMVHITENPTLGDIEDWEISNFTADAHPIHLHLVRFQLVGRATNGAKVKPGTGVEPWETGYKDTVISSPGRPGLYFPFRSTRFSPTRMVTFAASPHAGARFRIHVAAADRGKGRPRLGPGIGRAALLPQESSAPDRPPGSRRCSRSGWEFYENPRRTSPADLLHPAAICLKINPDPSILPGGMPYAANEGNAHNRRPDGGDTR